MKKKNQKGITLISLVVMIILILILASIGITSGRSTIESSKFTRFKTELTIMQNKVNELNQSNEVNLGEELTDTQKAILNKDEISNIIYKDKNEDEKNNIKNGFRYFSQEYIKKTLGLEEIKRDFLINVDKRMVVSEKGFEYQGTTYYMPEQFEDGLYNVEYNNKNENTGSFDVTTTKEDGKYKIQISNIQHNGYVNNWQVKYKLNEDNYWTTSNDLSFYVKKEGNYTIEVVHGNEISLGTKNERVMFDGPILDKVQNNVIKIGDYVKYTPDTASTSGILTELNTYSGSSDNTTDTLKQESLNWRVLDIKDGQVRLISEIPTNSKISLYGAKGYNNGVYLLDKVCKQLYNSSNYASTVQNLKIEDVEKNLTYDYKTYADYNSDIQYKENKYYPELLKIEKNAYVDETQGNELGISEQINPINEDSGEAKNSIKVKKTYWTKVMEDKDFKEAIYHKLFIKDNTNNNYSDYWLSSRCIDTYGVAIYDIRFISEGRVNANGTYHSDNLSYLYAFSFRPVITLNTDVEIDTTNTANDGKNSTNAWILK